MLDKTVSQADIAALMADIGRRAKAAARPLAIASTDQKNAALKAMADAISHAARKFSTPMRSMSKPRSQATWRPPSSTG
jgi:hypothetical protein